LKNLTETNGSRQNATALRLGFVLDYIPDATIISKEVALTRDSYTDRWLGALQQAGAEVTKYVPWRDAIAVETHRHRFGHRVKLLPLAHPIIPTRVYRTEENRERTGLPFQRLQSLAFTLNLQRELRTDRVQLLHYANYFTSMFVLSPIVSASAPVVTWFTGGDVPKSTLGKWSWFFALTPALRRVKGVMIGDYPERRRTLLWLLRGDGRKIRSFQLLRVDQRVFKPEDKSAARRSLGYDERSVNLISVMSLIPLPHDDPEDRQPFSMLRTFGEALKMTSDMVETSLTVIGTGPGLVQLKALAGELGIADRIRFEGRVEHDRLSTYYSAADLVFVPYRLEALNETNVLAEAFSCGRAVVAFRRSEGLPFMQPGGFLIGSDSSKGAGELVQILTQPATISKKSIEALSLSPQFRLDTGAGELLSAYSEMLGSK
jgi:glycosyltransferase involved in cell wall biosynthesis